MVYIISPPNEAHISVARQCSVRSWWNPERGLKPSCLRGDSNPDLSQQSRSTRLSGRFNPSSAITSVLNPSTKQAHGPWFDSLQHPFVHPPRRHVFNIFAQCFFFFAVLESETNELYALISEGRSRAGDMDTQMEELIRAEEVFVLVNRRQEDRLRVFDNQV